MKRNFKLIAAVLVLAVMALTLASCEYIEGTVGNIKDSVGNVIDKIVPHEHEFSADWSSDETNHWHAAICDKKDECASATADLAAHTFADGVCSVCGYKAEEEAPHEHVFVDGKCECGEADPNYVPTCTEHAYSITVTKEATCTEDGEKTLTCTVCGHSETQTVAPLGHEEKTIEGTAPTCTETGLSKGKVCNVCGETLTAQSEIPVLGHNFVEGACSVCGEVDPNYNGPKTYVFVTNTVVIYNEDGTQNLTDKAELPTDVTYCDGYFSIIGSVVQRVKDNEYVYCVELNKQDKGGVQFTVTGTATVSILFHSTGGSNTSWFGVRDADGNLVANNEGLNTVTGTGEGLTVTYNLTAGTYTVVSPALTNEEGKDPYNRAVRLYSISVTETPAEEEPKNELKVTTTDTYGYNDLYSFTADAEGYYTFNVPAGLGFYSKAKYDLYKDAEVDFYSNENGATAVIGLKAGETLEFYIGAMTKGDWLITWSFEAGEVIPEVEVCNHWWMPAMGHEQMVLPTCQTGGVIVSECFNCGEIKIEEVGPDTVDGHDYVTDMDSYVETTCQVDGYKKETCSLCGDVKETTFDHTIYGMHDNVLDEESFKEPTCQDAGYSKYVCSVCGEVTEEIADPDIWYHKDVYYANYSIAVCSVCDRVQLGVYVEATETSYGIQFGMNYGTGALWFAAFTADNSVFEMYGYTATLVDGVYTVTLDNMNAYETSAYGLLNATITVKPACGGVDVTITTAEGEAVTLKNYEGDGVHTYTYPCDKICSACYEETNLDATHTIVHVEAKAATCYEDGNVEHWYCSDCGIAWTDEALTQQTNLKSVILPMAHGEAKHVEAKAPTCYENGNIEYWLCEACGQAWLDEACTQNTNVLAVVLPMAHGEATHVAAKDATCTENGNIEYWLCEACGQAWLDEACTQNTNVLAVVLPSLGGHVDEDGDFKCDACSAKVLPEDGATLTIPQALAIAKLAGTSYTTQKYYITGIVTNVYNTTYGNLYLKDADGNEICIYGLYTADGKTRYDAMSYKPVEGDELTVYTVLGMYNTTAQGKNAWMDEVVAHEHNYTAVVTDPTCTKGGYTTHTCSICQGYTVDSETEALGHTTENGECERCGQTIGGDVVNNETFTADFNTVTNTNTSYAKVTTTSGWVATNAAVFKGGTTDSSPAFKMIGDASNRALCINGKTSAKGTITSPTISGGISKLSLKYGLPFSDTKIGFTVNIKQNGVVVASKTVTNSSASKLTAYTLDWDLAAEGVAVSGDFVIEIVNNSPSNSTSNKDRTAIWDVQWTTNY